MKTQYYTATTLDGYIADDNDSLDWLFTCKRSKEVMSHYEQFFSAIGAVAMGSTTYEWIVGNENLLEEPEKWPYEIPTWVFSSRELPEVEGADIRFVEGDVAPVHAEMVSAAGEKNIWLVGGGDLVGQFHDQGLLDELIINVAPVTLGSGKPLLPRKITTPSLKLVNVYSGGDFAVLTYAVQQGEE